MNIGILGPIVGGVGIRWNIGILGLMLVVPFVSIVKLGLFTM